MKKCECGGIPILLFKQETSDFYMGDERKHPTKIMCSDCGKTVVRTENNADPVKESELKSKWDNLMSHSRENCCPGFVLINESGNVMFYKPPIMPCVCGGDHKPAWKRVHLDSTGNVLSGDENIKLNQAGTVKIALVCPDCGRMSDSYCVYYQGSHEDVIESLRTAEKNVIRSWNNSIPSVVDILEK